MQRIAVLLLASMAVAVLVRAVAGPHREEGLRRTMGLEDGPSTPAAVLVFQLLDCAESRDALLSWMAAGRLTGRPPVQRLDPEAPTHAAAGSAPELRVRGVLVGPLPRDERRTREVLRVAGMTSLPVRLDEGGRVERLARALGYRETPVVLVFDRRGRLVLAGPPSRITPGRWWAMTRSSRGPEEGDTTP